jgi:membrane protease YdiL (CAAX protease family)
MSNAFLSLADRGANQIWRYVVTLLLIFLFLLIGSIPTVEVLRSQFPGSLEELANAGDPMPLLVRAADPNLVVFLVLLPFAFALGGLWVGVRFVHGRPLRTLVTPRDRVSWKRIAFGGGVWALLQLLVTGISFAVDPDAVTFQLDPARFAVLLGISLVMLPIQTSFEEMAFRGYLMQALGRWFRSPIVPVLTTSVLFAAMHIANPEVKAFGWEIMMPQYMIIGLLLALTTVLDESLEIALGVHAANNLLGVLLVTSPNGALPAPALFRTTQENPVADLLSLLGTAVVFLVLLRARYRWRFGKLFALRGRGAPPA